jgi:deazaflavin-dependent oxidoreductase (nitroreductase family)
MTDDHAESQSRASSAPSRGNGAPDPRADTMALQGLANRFVRGLLRVPLLSRVAGNRLITLYVVGRRSGKRYTVPVAYTRHQGALLIGSPFAWGKNLRTGEPVEVRFKGERRLADVCVLTDEAAVVEHYAVIARDNRSFARFNKIAYDRDGNPDPNDLRSAWAAGARGFRLTLR